MSKGFDYGNGELDIGVVMGLIACSIGALAFTVAVCCRKSGRRAAVVPVENRVVPQRIFAEGQDMPQVVGIPPVHENPPMYEIPSIMPPGYEEFQEAAQNERDTKAINCAIRDLREIHKESVQYSRDGMRQEGDILTSIFPVVTRALVAESTGQGDGVNPVEMLRCFYHYARAFSDYKTAEESGCPNEEVEGRNAAFTRFEEVFWDYMSRRSTYNDGPSAGAAAAAPEGGDGYELSRDISSGSTDNDENLISPVRPPRVRVSTRDIPANSSEGGVRPLNQDVIPGIGSALQ